MSKKHPRVIGTTPDAISRAEQVLGRRLPLSFHSWLLRHNGRWGLDTVRVFPVLDDRDPRTTGDSIVRNYQIGWQQALRLRPGATELLPFGEFGTGDYYCFDYARSDSTGELPVVIWLHETGGTEHRADSFAEFAQRVAAGELPD